MAIEALANPTVLAWARRMAALEAEDAARKAGVKPERLESWEEGLRRPTIAQLRKLADIYKRPLAVFYFRTVPPDDVLPSDFRRLRVETAEPLSPALRVVLREARARREAALEFFADLGERPPSFSVVASTNDNPEELGRRLRGALTERGSPPAGDSRLAFNYWRYAAEDAGISVFQAEHVQVSEMRGFSISERPLPAVVLNIKDAYAARSFSLFHELAHVVLNRGGLCLLEERGGQTEAQRTEAFCNHVAGAALLPADSLLREPEAPRQRVQQIADDALVSLARRYGVSEEAVLRRFVTLNRVPLAFYQRKRRAFQERYERQRREQTVGGFAPPYTLAVARAGRLFTRLVLEAYGEAHITASDVSAHLGVRLKHLERIRAMVRQGSSDLGESA